IDKSTLNSSNFYLSFAGSKLPATIVPAHDGTFAWLFPTQNLPGASLITLTVDGASIHAADGQQLDADGDGTPGGKGTFSFTTVGTASVSVASLSGIVADPGPDLVPGSNDDVRPGPDGVLMTSDDIYLHPIAGVEVYLLGLEGQK